MLNTELLYYIIQTLMFIIFNFLYPAALPPSYFIESNIISAAFNTILLNIHFNIYYAINLQQEQW